MTLRMSSHAAESQISERAELTGFEELGKQARWRARSESASPIRRSARTLVSCLDGAALATFGTDGFASRPATPIRSLPRALHTAFGGWADIWLR
jgi:hypothetical protein